MTTALQEAPSQNEMAQVAEILGPLDEPGIKFTQLGLKVSNEVSYEQWAQYGRKLALVKKGVQWAIGDWINHGERAYGEKYAQAVAETGLKEETLMNYAAVARAFKTSRRSEVLPLSTHAVVMGLEDEADQDAVLQEAAENDLPRQRVRRVVTMLKHQKGPKPDEEKYVHSKADREFLDEYLKALSVLDDNAPRVPAFRYMNHAQHGHVLWQKERTIETDCCAIREIVVRNGGSIDESDLFVKLHEAGYFMSDPEFEDRLEYMNRDDVRLAKITNAGEGKQENRRGKLPNIIVVPWVKVWEQGKKRERDEDDD